MSSNDYCSLHGILYRKDTIIPIHQRYGDSVRIWNQATRTYLETNNGNVKLEGGGIYTTEVIGKDKSDIQRTLDAINITKSRRVSVITSIIGKMSRSPSSEQVSPASVSLILIIA